MGLSPLSPIIVDVVIQDLENEVLSTFDFDISFFYRYVDDIMAIPTSRINIVLTNSIQYTLDFNLLYIGKWPSKNQLFKYYHHNRKQQGFNLIYITNQPSQFLVLQSSYT